MYTRKNLKELFNINIKGITRIERELNLYDSLNTKNKVYTEQQFLNIKNLIKEKYTLPKQAVQIKNSLDYVCPDGSIFKQIRNTGLYIKAKFTIIHGYLYCGIKFEDGNKSCRVHRIVAETFIKNNDELKNCVNHIDGNKLNNNVSNLEWCSVSENTKHAFDNGLAKNDRGFNDSQSIQVDKYDIDGNFIKTYGSISEASLLNNIPKNTIINQCKNNSLPRKYKFYFRYHNK